MINDHDGDDGDNYDDPIILIILFIVELVSKAVITPTMIIIIKLISGLEYQLGQE